MNKPIIDKALNLKLANHDPDLARDVLHMLCTMLPNDIQTIETTLKQQDFIAAKNAVHKLQGAICYCGVPRLQDAISNLGKSLHQKEYAKIEEQMKILKDEAAHLTAVVLPFVRDIP
ncbi:MAG: Hpt domain-containing protein [Gammaproteobacteria bacterium]|nr:Hpt domain-containing protein [Gammaproteobacteria bacterium]